MKRFFNIAAITTMFVLAASLDNKASAQDDDYYQDDYYENGDRGEVSYQTFYDELSPHGRWIDNPQHGYVWVPNAGRDFRPYSTNGHWVYTDNYEWMWVSDYSWGWAPFHYGRWDYDPFYGWVWVPGYEWAPAWVVWRSGGDYYGWAPIRPGISISINIGFGGYSPPYDFWCFAPRRYITSPRIHNYYYDRGRNVTIINQTTIINNYNYSNRVWRTGPSRYDVERYAGRITPVRFRESSRPGRTQFRNNEVSVYRPRVQQDDSRRFTPRNVERYDRQSGGSSVRTRGNDRFERNGDVRTNDARTRGNERFERNSDARSNDARTRGNGNNLPRRERDGSIDTRDQQVRDRAQQPRGFERRSPEVNNDNRGNQRREMRTMDRSQQPQQPQAQPRGFERRSVDRERPQQSQPQAQPRSFERPQQSQPQAQQRNFERRETRQVERSQPQVEQRSSDAGSSGGFKLQAYRCAFAFNRFY